LIDLHLHTTASDGLLAPAALIARAAAAELTILSVTDHDTVAGLAEASRAADDAGLRLVPGIEITAVERGRDVHLLGYFIDPGDERLRAFLDRQRADRVRRVREMGRRLEVLGFPIDVEAVLAERGTRSVGRPALADALVAAGHAASRDDVFARLLGRGRPAFVPRAGATGREVIDLVHAAGGIVSLAHPGVLADDDLIPPLVQAGLDAIEVWHSDHTPADEARYGRMAEEWRLARSGGSDYHGDGVHRACRLGEVALPAAAFAVLAARAGRA
jgi:predicted metal-dependent phosphoesterase TrpH